MSTIQIYIENVCRTYLTIDKVPELLELWKTMQDSQPKHSGTCTALLQSGKRKGEECGKASGDSGFCKAHEKKAPVHKADEKDPENKATEKKSCTFVLVAGKNKGVTCTKLVRDNELFCTAHGKKVKDAQEKNKVDAQEKNKVDEEVDEKEEEKEIQDEPVKEKKKSKKTKVAEEKEKADDEEEIKDATVKEKKKSKKADKADKAHDEEEEKKEEPARCPMLLQSGKRKGETCDKVCIGETDRCVMHQPKVTANTCIVQNDGKPCGKPCKTDKKTCEGCENNTIMLKKGRDGYFFIQSTKVLFDMERKVCIGYATPDNKYVFEENEEVRDACVKYGTVFSAQRSDEL